MTFSGIIAMWSPRPTSRSLSLVPFSSASKMITSLGLPLNAWAETVIPLFDSCGSALIAICLEPCGRFVKSTTTS